MVKDDLRVGIVVCVLAAVLLSAMFSGLPSALCPSLRTVTIVVSNVGNASMDYTIYFENTSMWSDTIDPGETIKHSWVKKWGFWNDFPDVVFLQTPNTIHQLEPVRGKNYFMVD